MSDKLPHWFIYLQSAFPSARLENPRHTAAIITQHLNEFELSEAQRLEVAKEAAASSDWWPTVTRLRGIAKVIATRPNKDEGVAIGWARRHAAFVAREVELKEERLQMPICPDCGEHTPNVADCPFCRDIERMKAEEAAAA